MATLTSTITESILLNGTAQGSTQAISITGINDCFKRIILVPASETILYTTDTSAVAGSTFDRDNIKYTRITNLDGTNNVDLLIQNSADDEVAYRLGPYQSYVVWNHGSTILDADGSALTVVAGVTASASLSIADGDDNTNGQFTEGEYVKFIATDSTVGIFILSDSAETGAVSSGTVLTSTSDLGTTVPSASLLAAGTCVAVTMNLNTCTQALLLNELRDTMGASTSPLLNKVSGAAGTVPSSNGSQSLVFTQAIHGTAGNTVTTTDISQLTAPDFTSGVDGEASATKVFIKSINAISQDSPVRVQVFVAST